MRMVGAALIALMLGGCESAGRLRTDLSAARTETGDEQRALIAAMREAYSGCAPDAASRNSTSCSRFKIDSEIELGRFTGAGFTLSDYYCDGFFRHTNQAARHRRFGRNLNNDVGGAVATVLGLAKAGSGVVGGVAAGSSLADGQFRNYDESFMVDADLAKLRRLVLSAQDNMKLAVRAAPPKTVFAAESTILRYAGLCSFLGMQDLLNESVAEKTALIEAKNKQLQPTAAPVVAPASTLVAPPTPAPIAPQAVPDPSAAPPPPPPG